MIDIMSMLISCYPIVEYRLIVEIMLNFVVS